MRSSQLSGGGKSKCAPLQTGARVPPLPMLAHAFHAFAGVSCAALRAKLGNFAEQIFTFVPRSAAVEDTISAFTLRDPASGSGWFWLSHPCTRGVSGDSCLRCRRLCPAGFPPVSTLSYLSISLNIRMSAGGIQNLARFGK